MLLIRNLIYWAAVGADYLRRYFCCFCRPHCFNNGANKWGAGATLDVCGLAIIGLNYRVIGRENIPAGL